MIDQRPDLTRSQRRAGGVYYTPDPLVKFLVQQTLSASASTEYPRILDPACGAGFFLVEALRFLLRQRSDAAPACILREQIFGVDIDPVAVEMTRKTLQREVGCDIDLENNIRCGDALQSPSLFAEATADPFDIVIGNPPWGQKRSAASPRQKRELWTRFPSSVGIFDWFRPFVELGVRLTRHGGQFGMVLPDIVLLKNYEPTRRFLLDQLQLEAIDWWGQAFPGAVIDAVTIIGTRARAASDHCVQVTIRSAKALMRHAIPQADFRANPRQTFNLFLTPQRRRILDRLAGCPRLGDYFEAHEGVHSGNLRAELFVENRSDASCHELLVGRNEMRPYYVEWAGRYVRLAALPAKKTRERYANLGRPEWHRRPKVLVRRTGDRVIAAVDSVGRFASNNFFLVLPCSACSLDLDGLCALLNSRFMTWYFRTVEPRQGRVFAELKIKHLSLFPLPGAVRQPDGCHMLNELGRRRAGGEKVDEQIDTHVADLFGISVGQDSDPDKELSGSES
jgi:tRNA1(Val) A37 N6-methylase TrmN6